MNPLVETIDISRRPDEVFAYAADFSRFSEWQVGVQSARPDGFGPTAVGSTARVVRRVGPRLVSTTERVTELSAPRRWVVHGEGGLPIPMTVIASGVVEPVENGASSRVTIALDFNTHGIGELLMWLVVRRTARRGLRQNMKMLK